MKYLFYILVFIFSNEIFAQKVDNSEVLQGKWFLTNYGKSGDMIFEKAEPNKLRWGYYMCILPKSELSIGYSAQCGNDPNRFYETGEWNFNNMTKTFITTIDVHKRGKVFTIKFISNSKMVFE